MTHEQRIEAAARAIYDTWAAENAVTETWEELDRIGHSFVRLARAEAAAALAAAYPEMHSQPERQTEGAVA